MREQTKGGVRCAWARQPGPWLQANSILTRRLARISAELTFCGREIAEAIPRRAYREQRKAEDLCPLCSLREKASAISASSAIDGSNRRQREAGFFDDVVARF